MTDGNETPTAISLTIAAAKENTPGIVIGRLTVTDEDVGDSHTLTVSHDDFELDGDVLRLKAGRSLSFDEDDPITLVSVTAVDAGGLSYTEQIAIVVLAHPLPWQNEANTADANNDGFVSPADALVIINYINQFGPANLPVPPPATIVLYYDTNGDGSVSPVDVLIVVNLLNSAQAEGESVGSEAEFSLSPGAVQASPLIDSSISLVSPMKHPRLSSAVSTDRFSQAIRDASRHERQRTDAIAYERNLERIDIDDLLDELREFKSPKPIDEVFAEWQAV